MGLRREKGSRDKGKLREEEMKRIREEIKELQEKLRTMIQKRNGKGNENDKTRDRDGE